MSPVLSIGAVTDRIESALTPSTAVEAVVESKVVLGRRDGETHGVVLAHEEACNVGDPAFADAFDGRRRPITVGDEVGERLAAAYDEVAYDLHLTLAGPDDVNGLAAGRTVAYRVPRGVFDRTTCGQRVRAVVVDGRRVRSVTPL